MQFSLGEWIWGLLLVTVWHELGHLAAARLVGLPVRRIYVGMGPILWQRPLYAGIEFALRALPVGMSIAVTPRHDASGTRNRPIAHDLWMAAGGPLASFALSLLLVVMAALLPSLDGQLLIGLATLSTLVVMLNLLPIPGLDGGHLLLLLADGLGRRLSPAGERRAHRLGMRAMMALSAAMLVLILWQQTGSMGQ